MKLLPLTFDPFKSLPELNTIWEARNAVMTSDVKQYLCDCGTERKFLIIVNDDVVGITGYFKVGRNVGLAWHGIIPKYRGNKYSGVAIKLLISEIKKDSNFRHCEELIEFVPADRQEELSKYFKSLGFVKKWNAKNTFLAPGVNWIRYSKKL